MNRSFYRAACACALLVGSAALVVAQQAQPPAQPRPGQPRAQPAQPGQPGQLGQPGQPGQFGRPGGLQAQQLEPSILTLLIIDNNKEIALGQLGQQTTQNEHVKHFCEMLVKDHSSFVQKLQERSGSSSRPTQRIGATTPGDQNLATAGRDAAAQPRDAATAAKQDRTLPGQDLQAATKQERGQKDQGQETRTAAEQQRGQRALRILVAKPVIGNQPGSELLQLHHELAEKCLDSARQEAEKLGAHFDTHFLGAQIVGHKGMLDKLQVFQQHVSPQTRQLLAQAQETTKKHLEEAKSLHEQLSKEGGGAGARDSERKSETTTRDR